jgi:glutamate-1-semialdehyde aminotransferase
LVGKADIMDVLAGPVFLSSTFFPNSLSLVAALKAIEIMERDGMLGVIREKGKRFAKRVTAHIADSGIPCTFSGGPWMPFITFHKDAEGRYKRLREAFYAQLIRRGVFLQPYHHGYIAYRHTGEDLDRAADRIAESLDYLKTVT